MPFNKQWSSILGPLRLNHCSETVFFEKRKTDRQTDKQKWIGKHSNFGYFGMWSLGRENIFKRLANLWARKKEILFLLRDDLLRCPIGLSFRTVKRVKHVPGSVAFCKAQTHGLSQSSSRGNNWSPKKKKRQQLLKAITNERRLLSLLPSPVIIRLALI